MSKGKGVVFLEGTCRRGGRGYPGRGWRVKGERCRVPGRTCRRGGRGYPGRGLRLPASEIFITADKSRGPNEES